MTWLKALGITLLQLLFIGIMLGLLGGAMWLAYVSIEASGGWVVLFGVAAVILYSMTKDNKRKLEDQRECAAKNQ